MIQIEKSSNLRTFLVKQCVPPKKALFIPMLELQTALLASMLNEDKIRNLKKLQTAHFCGPVAPQCFNASTC